MRRLTWESAGSLALALACVVPCAASVACSVSTDAAVLQALRGGEENGSRFEGYRVRDVVVDPLLHRAFVHVEQCGHPERPLVLLPFALAQASVPVGLRLPPSTAGSAMQPGGATVLSGSVVAVAMGDAHMRLTVQGRLVQNAAVGSDVDVQLLSLQEGPPTFGEEPKHVHGRLTAADRVEVKP